MSYKDTERVRLLYKTSAGNIRFFPHRKFEILLLIGTYSVEQVAQRLSIPSSQVKTTLDELVKEDLVQKVKVPAWSKLREHGHRYWIPPGNKQKVDDLFKEQKL